MQLRAISDLGISRLKELVAQRAPVVERELFPRADPAFPVRLLTTIKSLDELKASYSAFGLLSSQTYSEDEEARYYRITPERLSTMMATREASLEQQRWLAELDDSSQS